MDKKNTIVQSAPSMNFKQNGAFVTLDPYISPVNQVRLLKDYIETYFSSDNFADNSLLAEWGLILGVIDKQTSIPIKVDTSQEEFKDVKNIDLESIITSGLWDDIRERVLNFPELKSNIAKVVSRIEKQKEINKSVGAVLDNLSNKLMVFLDKVSSIDMSSEGVKSLVTELKTVADKYNEDFNIHPKPKKKIVKKDLVQ
jgi:hypothetical protein